VIGRGKGLLSFVLADSLNLCFFSLASECDLPYKAQRLKGGLAVDDHYSQSRLGPIENYGNLFLSCLE